MNESDWDVFLEKLLSESRVTIQSFARDHATEEICYFAFDAEPEYGCVHISLNTSRASREHARKQRDHHTLQRKRLLEKPAWFDHAYYQARVHSILPFCDNSGDFAFQCHTNIQFPEWQNFAESSKYIEQDDSDKDYLNNRVARLFCRAIDRLVDEGAFQALRLASPTLVGFGFHDHGQYVIEILNLPGAE